MYKINLLDIILYSARFPLFRNKEEGEKSSKMLLCKLWDIYLLGLEEIV